MTLHEATRRVIAFTEYQLVIDFDTPSMLWIAMLHGPDSAAAFYAADLRNALDELNPYAERILAKHD